MSYDVNTIFCVLTTNSYLLFTLLFVEPGPNTKSRSKLRSSKSGKDLNATSTTDSGVMTAVVENKKKVADDQKRDEMEIIALSRLLESKQRTYATLGQSNATLSTVALQVSKQEFDMQNPVWQDYIQSTTLMRKLLEEIQELEAQLLERTTGSSRKKSKVSDDGDGNDVEFVYTTPRSSMSTTSTSTTNGTAQSDNTSTEGSNAN